MIGNFKIVDGHVHTFSSEEIAEKIIKSFNEIYSIEFENPGNGTIENVQRNMITTGIDYTIMANFAPPKIIDENNLWTLNISNENRQLIPLVSFHPDMEGDLSNHLEVYINKGAKGIKLHPMAQGFLPDSKRLHEMYRICDDIGLPVVFHCGRVANARLNEYSDLDMIMPIINKYSTMPIILTHMVDGDINAVLKLSSNYKNVYFDTSIVITGYPPIMSSNEPSWLDDKVVEDVINKAGADRIIFGSDFPWGSPSHDLNRILKLDISDLNKKLLLGENAIRVFKIE